MLSSATATNGEAAATHSAQTADLHATSNQEDDLAHELSIEVSYEDTYDTLIFLGVSFTMGEIAYYCGIPPLV